MSFITEMDFGNDIDGWIDFQVKFSLFKEKPELLPKKVRRTFEKHDMGHTNLVCSVAFSDDEMKKAQIISEGIIRWVLFTGVYPKKPKNQQENDDLILFYYGLGKCKNPDEAREYLQGLGIGG